MDKFISQFNTEKPIEETDEVELEEREEKIDEFKTKIEELEKQVKEMQDLLEKHKHSGKETSDISMILSDRLGLKMSVMVGAAESVSFDFAGILQSIGRAAFGKTVINSLGGEYFGIEWTDGNPPYFTTNAEFLLPVYASDPTAIIGSIYYNTTDHKVKVNENGVWKTITTS